MSFAELKDLTMHLENEHGHLSRGPLFPDDNIDEDQQVDTTNQQAAEGQNYPDLWPSRSNSQSETNQTRMDSSLPAELPLPSKTASFARGPAQPLKEILIRLLGPKSSDGKDLKRALLEADKQQNKIRRTGRWSPGLTYEEQVISWVDDRRAAKQKGRQYNLFKRPGLGTSHT